MPHIDNHPALVHPSGIINTPECAMSARVIQLHQPRQSAPESFSNRLRRLANEFEAGQVAVVSIVATTNDGKVETRHSADAPALKRK